MKDLRLVSYILNGLNFASYELNSFRYRAQAIESRQEIAIPRLERLQVMRLDLLGVLTYPLLVTGISVDVTDDDATHLQENRSQNNRGATFELYVSVVNRKTGLVLRKMAFRISNYPDYTNEIILNPDYIYDVKASVSINLLTFIGKPVYLEKPIVFTDRVIQH